jgi:hypothetical protein
VFPTGRGAARVERGGGHLQRWPKAERSRLRDGQNPAYASVGQGEDSPVDRRLEG